jgi:enamine deaminase RidA (YjgF/YER057c/UK114 family)
MSRIDRTESDTILSRAVEYHNFIYTAGVVPKDPTGDVAAQTKDVLAQIDALLEKHGTDNTRLLQAQIWLKNMGDRAAMNAVWSSWLPAGMAPARACVEAVLADPRWLVEIMITATK